AKLLNLVDQLIQERIKPWDPKMVIDPVQERLLDIIASKKKGRKKPAKAKTEEEEDRPSNVVSIMDALRKSLDTAGKKRK
ncbi:Ku protein, partial [Rhizobiaceae sp. 2RAB30]